MKVIKDYIEVLFLQVPITEETKNIKEDLLASAEDHYYGLIEDGKSEKEAIGIVISEFGTIDEILTALDLEKADYLDEEIDAYEVEALSIEEAFDYWHEVRRLSFGIATGLFFSLFAFAFIPVVSSSHSGFFAGMGLLLMFLFWALGFLFMTINGYSFLKNIRGLKKRTISTKVREEALEQSEGYRRSYLTGISASVITYALSLPAGIFFHEYVFYGQLGISIFLGLFAIATFLIAYVFLIQREYRRLVKMNLKAQKKRKKQELRGHRKSIFHHEDTFWIMVTLLYFVFSFLFNSWLYSWLIFLVGYVVQAILKNREGQGEYN